MRCIHSGTYVSINENNVSGNKTTGYKTRCKCGKEVRLVGRAFDAVSDAQRARQTPNTLRIPGHNRP